ncbi:hypothetical protein SODALDRAFT_333596 [Sodiomyces alkalinus F11]|uniref:Uncharacterized protein n=1 Tax=Sodiomyces alkalinus (strain CBS 110278 / VKM F-3762 / F11) TaxID=1314773 RepID=A0A3N2PTM5_SODAK|nr:hypothetical protein SODALDRAFT_333596 [Sodiomyces alkalinus F11]ROT37848.1 hypothetical protein SODALDRAFT_333596 [Sodiomyces alkalinus F11]
MRFSTLLPVMAAAVTACHKTTEYFDGYKYILSGPKNPAPKAEYEMAAAQTAITLLTERLGANALLDLVQPEFADPHDDLLKALPLIKERIGADGLIDLLQPAIAEADAYWHDVLDKSGSGWVDASGRGVLFLPNMTAQLFAGWSQSPLADEANNAGNPEHYLKRTREIAPGVLRSEILEGWGGVTTHFTVEDYGMPPNRQKWPFLNTLPDFPIQAAGGKTLLDGTLFGVLHISVRDVPGEEFGEEQDGIEIYASVWYGDGVDDDHLEDERTHIITEIVNLSLQAQRDVESGRFPPSGN